MKVFSYQTPTGVYHGTFVSAHEGQGTDVTYNFKRIGTGQIDVVQGAKVLSSEEIS